MHILLFSHDKTLFREGSESRARMAERGRSCDSLTILVPTSRGFSEQQLAADVRVMPTNSRNKFWSFWDMKRVAKKVIQEEWGSSLSFPRRRESIPLPPVSNIRIDSRLRGNDRNMENDKSSQDFFIISQDPFEFGWIARSLAKKFYLPWQVELHGDFYFTGYWKWSGPLYFFRHYLGLRILRSAKCIRVVSERLRASLVLKLNIPDSRVSVFPVEVKTAQYLTASRSTFLQEKYGNFDFFLLTVGVLNPVKNIGLQIRALHDIVEKHPKTALVIVGDGPERSVLEMLAHKLRVAQNVIFVGTQKDLLPYYSSADVFLLTSHAEGWGRVIVEAMASGLAVAMTDVGLAGELVLNGKNGMVIPRGGEKELVRAIEQLHENAYLRKRLGETARETVRALPSHEEVLQKYQESWERCAINH